MLTSKPCTHPEPEPGWTDKHKKQRYFKGKHYVWIRCPGCGLIILWCE